MVAIIGYSLHNRVIIAAVWFNLYVLFWYAISQVPLMPMDVGFLLRMVLLLLSCICKLEVLITMVGFCMMNVFSTGKCNPYNCIDCQTTENHFCPNSLYGNDFHFFFAWGCDDNVIPHQYTSEWTLENQECHIDCDLVWNPYYIDWSFLIVTCGPHYLNIYFVIVLLDLEMLKIHVDLLPGSLLLTYCSLKLTYGSAGLFIHCS